MSLCAFMLEDGIQTYLQFTLYEGFICTWKKNSPNYIWDEEYKCKIRPHNKLSLAEDLATVVSSDLATVLSPDVAIVLSSDLATVAFSSIVTLVGSIYKLYTIVSSLRYKPEHSPGVVNQGPGPFCRFWCNGFTKNRIIITLMFIGTFSNGVMNVLRIANLYFIYGEHEISLLGMYFLIGFCIWLTFVSYSLTLVVYFTFDITKDQVFRNLNLIGVFICSGFLAFSCLNIDRANDASMVRSFMDIIALVVIPIGVGLFCHCLAFIDKCIRIDKRVSNNVV